jgi:hypothetical protein
MSGHLSNIKYSDLIDRINQLEVEIIGLTDTTAPLLQKISNAQKELEILMDELIKRDAETKNR